MKVLARRAKEQEKPPAPEPVETIEEPEYDPIKVTLVNTPLKEATLLRGLAAHDGPIGFDTEVVGALLRGRDFVNMSHAALLGLSLSFKKRNYYVPVRHKGNNVSFPGLDRIAEAISKACGEGRVWAHNAKFEHQAMALEGYKVEGLLCSMLAAWLVTGKNKGIGLKDLAYEILDRKSPPYDPTIGSKTGHQVKFYAGHDSRNTLDLGEHYAALLRDDDLWDWFREECLFTHTLGDMERQGMRIDYAPLHALADDVRVVQDEVKAQWEKLAPKVEDKDGNVKPASISSAKQQQVLFEEGIWLPKGMTKAGAFGTGDKAMKWNILNARGDGKRLAALKLEYQEVAKIVSTYSDGLVEEARQWRDGKLHPGYYHFGTVTGRLSASKPGIQQQPAHGQFAERVREAYIPDPGQMFTAADYSQVELRYFAEYCGGSLLQAFLNGADLHQRTAAAMEIQGDDKETPRDKGKTVNFGFLLYGGAPKKLADDVLKCSEAEAKEKISAMHAEYPEVERWRQRIIAEADASSGACAFVHTLAGRIRHIPELNPDWVKARMPELYKKLSNKYVTNCRMAGRAPKPNGTYYSIRSRGERLVVNYLIQGGARDLLVLGMNAFRRKMPDDWKIITTVHDEVLTQHPDDPHVAEHARELLATSLQSAGPLLGLKVPILAEPKSGYTWAEVK